MPYSDEEKQRAYQRDYQRNRRAAAGLARKTLNPDNSDYTTAAQVRELLAEVLADVADWQGDVIIRARAAAYVAGVVLRAIETTDLERRITALEGGGQSGPPEKTS